MPVIRLSIKENALDKVMNTLKSFSTEEVEILKEDQNYLLDQKYLHQELEEIKLGKAEFVSHEELESSVNDVIAKYENNL